MKSIKYYKLVSPYPEDITKNCKLTMAEIDENFLAFKDNDISAATYNTSGMTINIIRNNGEEINLDISSLNDNIETEVKKQLSGISESISGVTIPDEYHYYIGVSNEETINQSVVDKLEFKNGRSSILYSVENTKDNDYIWLLLPEPIQLNYWLGSGMAISTYDEPQSIDIDGITYNAYRNLVKLEENEWNLTIVTKGSEFDKYGINFGVKDIELKGSVSEDGVLTLTWKNTSGETSTTISGFVTTENIYHTSSINGNGSKENPLRIPNLLHTEYNIGVKAIVNELPKENLHNGDKYVTVNKQSNFGCLYNKQGMLTIVDELAKINSNWRVPTKEDWDKLLDFCEICDADCQHDGKDIDVEYGKLAGKVLKSIDFWDGNENLDKLGMSIFPTGLSNNQSELIDENEKAIFWTNTLYDTNNFYLKGFNNDSDAVAQIASDYNKYSIRLVADYYGEGLNAYTNLFGKDYEVVVLKDINQIWISTNLDYYIGSLRSDSFEYENATISNIHTINHWNGEYWEKKELENGSIINVGDDIIKKYKVLNDINDTKIVLLSTTVTDEFRNTTTKIDSGWY